MTRCDVSDGVFPLLADPAAYVACAHDLRDLDALRSYWLDLFARHLVTLADEIRAHEAADPRLEERLNTLATTFRAHLDAVAARPGCFGRLDIISLCRARERALRAAGIDDAYRATKASENEHALALLPALLQDLDAIDPRARAVRLIEGIFAGNIFDLGAPRTLELFRSGRVDFHRTRRELRARPWLFDDLDAWLDRWQRGPHRSAVLFVDNAGFDVVLGMIPFARELLRRGTAVLVTANTTPSLNDVTHAELTILAERIAALDTTWRDALADGRLALVGSGNGLPLIDLTRLSPALSRAVRQRDVDLVVLEGMGRAVESNFDAAFTCDALKIAMIKDEGVAEMMGGQMYDLVCRYDWSG